MQRVREFEPGDIASAAAFIREVAETHPRVYVEELRGGEGWQLVYGDDAPRAAEYLARLSGNRRFRIRSMRLT